MCSRTDAIHGQGDPLANRLTADGLLTRMAGGQGVEYNAPVDGVAFASESLEGKAKQLRLSLESLKLGDLRNMLKNQDLTPEDLRAKLGLPDNFMQNTTAADRVDITKLVALEYGTELASAIMARLFGAAQ